MVKTVRDAIYDRLTTICTSFTGGFWQPQVADETTVKPFGVVRMGPEESQWRQGRSRKVYVHVHCSREDHNTLDTLCRSVVTALNDVEVVCGTSTDAKFKVVPSWLGTTADASDEDRETIFRIVEFEVMTGG